MKVLFTITGPWGTGAATVVEGVAQELLNLGHSVKVVFPDLGLPSPDADKYYGNPELYHIIKFPVEYKGIQLDCGYRIDILIEDRLIVELKAVEAVKEIHKAQLLTYMKLSGIETGPLVNFNVKRLKEGIKRFKL